MKRRGYVLFAISLIVSLIGLSGCRGGDEQVISKKADSLMATLRIYGFLPAYESYYGSQLTIYFFIDLSIKNTGKAEEYIRDLYIIDTEQGKVYRPSSGLDFSFGETLYTLKPEEIFESSVWFTASELPKDTDKLKLVVQYGSLKDKMIEFKLPRLNSVQGATFLQISELPPVWEKKIKYELAFIGNTIYVIAAEVYSNDHLIALDAKNGTTIWEKYLSDDIQFSGLPVFSCNYIGSDGSYFYFYWASNIYDNFLIQAIEKETGRTVWLEEYFGHDYPGKNILEASSYLLTEKGIKIISMQSPVNEVKYGKLVFKFSPDIDLNHILQVEDASSEEVIGIKDIPSSIQSLEIQENLLYVHGSSIIQVFDVKKFPQP